MTDKLREDIEGTRARIATLRGQLANEEDRLAKLRGVEQAQFANQVKAYDSMSAAEREQLRSESPETWEKIMQAQHDQGMAALMGSNG